MSDETTTQEQPTEQAKRPGRPAKGVSIHNTTSRLVTLIASRNDKVSVLPTETKEVSKEFMAEIRKNSGAMTFFESGELVEV